MDRRLIVALGIVAAGYAWIAMNAFQAGEPSGMPEVCFVKNTAGIPCPSCGTTRSVMRLLSGDPAGAAAANPFGLLVAAGLLIVPGWIARDLATRRSTFLRRLESLAAVISSNPRITVPLAILVALNWGWNILKYS